MIKVYHYLGYEALFAKKSYQTALNYFAQSNRMAKLAKVEEDNYLAGNQLYMGVCHDNLLQRDRAIQAYENTLDMEENTLYKEDAKKYLKAPAVGTP
jgi:tetratricopeptide (TPR) repeat protein